MRVVDALGADLERPEDADGCLRRFEVSRARRTLEPVVAHRIGEPLIATLRMPEKVEPTNVWLTLRCEDGALSRRKLSEVTVARTASLTADGASIVSRRLRIRVCDLLPGYHRLEVEGPGVSDSSLVICAPRRAPEPERAWGVFVPLHALRTDADWGVGSFGDLGRLGGFVRDLGGGFVGTLPLSAVFSDVPFADPSPYMPASRLAWNEAYIDIEQVPELAACAEARAIVDSPALHEQLASLRCVRLADPQSVAHLKRQALEALARFVCSSRSPRREALASFSSDRPELVAYARFRATCERLGRPFWEWRESPAGAPVSLDSLEGPVLTHLYSQWIAEEQLRAARSGGTGLYLDFPVGVHPAGFDPWWEPECFADGVSGGAPPDTFFSEGQVWGFPPLHPEGVRENGYSYLIAALRHTMRQASIVRVDHVMGLHRLYWVPEGASARDGAYVHYKADELHAVLCLEAHRCQTAVVGEDLGTVPGYVHRAMDRDGIARSFVFEFASTRDDPFPTPTEYSIASLATHDLPPFAAYWRGLDIEERSECGELAPARVKSMADERASWRQSVLARLEADPVVGRCAPVADPPVPLDRPDQPVPLAPPDRPDPFPSLAQPADQTSTWEGSTRRVLTACLAHLSSSPARMVMADLEDLWLETEPQNRPGTGAEAGNFLRRARHTFEEVQTDPEATQLLVDVNRLRHAL